MTPWPYPRWVAHRGAGLLAPENTLAAFKLGAQRGFQMFECDAKLSSDGVVFLMHDATLDRTTNGIGEAGSLTWPALSELDAGSWHSSAFNTEPVPRLRTIARWLIARKLMLNIEIKPTPGTEVQTGEAVAREAAQLWASSNTLPLLSSFQRESLKAAARIAPHLPRGLLMHEWHDDAFDHIQQHRHRALICNHKIWTAERLRKAKELGIWRLSYTVNDPVDAQQLWQWGHEALITDAIDVFHPQQAD